MLAWFSQNDNTFSYFVVMLFVKEDRLVIRHFRLYFQRKIFPPHHPPLYQICYSNESIVDVNSMNTLPSS